jgi:enoyl-CoA hydratase
MSNFRSVAYHQDGRIARITLNRPASYNAIDPYMPTELKQCIQRANDDPNVRVILLSGAGDTFCTGYDLKIFAETPRPCPGSQDYPWDPIIDFKLMNHNTDCFMEIWRSMKPVISKIHGYAIAGGSDIALCSDFLFMTRSAKIGYPPGKK